MSLLILVRCHRNRANTDTSISAGSLLIIIYKQFDTKIKQQKIIILISKDMCEV